MTSIFCIVRNNGDIYSLDCSESFECGEAGSLTEYAIESGAKVSDHYVNENKDFSLTGIITDIKSKSSTSERSTDDYISGLFAIKDSREPFKLYYRGESERLDRFFDNVVFTNVRFAQDANNGYSNGIYAYKVSLSMKQIIFSNRATVTIAQVPKIANPKIKDSAAPQANSNASTTNKFLPGISPLPPATQTVTGIKTDDPNNKRLAEQLAIRAKGG